MLFRIRQIRLIATAAGIAVLCVIVALLVARQNQQELMRLSVDQGSTLVEALSQILRSERVTSRERDILVNVERKRFSTLLWDQLSRAGGPAVASLLAGQRGTTLIAIIGPDSTQHIFYGPKDAVLPDLVRTAAFDLLKKTDTNFLFITPDDDSSSSNFYLERSNSGREVLVLHEPLLGTTAQTDLFHWAKQLEQDSSLLFVSWETPTDVIVASDGFYEADSAGEQLIVQASRGEEILDRIVETPAVNWLELIRPFPTLEQPLGVFRVALPLTTYYDALARAYRQIALSTLLALAVIVAATVGIAMRGRRREQDEAFQSLRGLFSNVLNSLELGVVVTDESNQIRLANNWLPKEIGIQAREGVALTSLPSTLFDQREEISGAASAVNDIAGHIRWLQTTVVPLSLPNRQRWRLIFVHDRTEMRLAEERLQRQSRLSELGELAAGVAHDIRNPLHTISLGLQQLISPAEVVAAPAEQANEIIALLRDEVARINRTVTRFLSLTKAIPVEQEALELRSLLEARVSAWLPQALEERKEITLEGESVLMVISDGNRLRDILDNLLRNSLEAVQSGVGKICVRLTCSDAQWVVMVDDNGVGVSPDDSRRIFSPGYTTKATGTGIGLALVEKRVGELGGKVDVQSSPLGGARFTLTFPRSADHSRIAQPT